MSGTTYRSYGPRTGPIQGATWEHDPKLKLESKPTDVFPTHPNLKRPALLTGQERRRIELYKTLQTKIRRGPLYTHSTRREIDAPTKTFSEDAFNRQYGTNKKADMNPFTSMETYSSRMAPKTNDIPKLSERPFNKDLFPKELWSTLNGTEGKEVRKTLDKAEVRKKELAAMNPTERTKAILARMEGVVGVDDDGEEVDEENGEEVEVDSEFDDEDMGGDYDGEQYFNNGEEGSEDGNGGDDEAY